MISNMRSCYLDANILVTYKNKLSPQYKSAIEIISALTEGNYSLIISPLVIDEFLHAMKFILHVHKQIYKALHEVLTDVLKLPGMTLVNSPTDIKAQFLVIEIMEKFHLRPRDAYHLLTMQTHEILLFATFDTDFDLVFKAKLVERFTA